MHAGVHRVRLNNTVDRNVKAASMGSAKCNTNFDLAMRLLSGFSIVGTLVTLLAVFCAPRHVGPEPSSAEVLLIFINIAQFALLAVSVIIAVILAGFRGGLRLTRLGAKLILVAICGYVLEILAINHYAAL